MMIELENEKVSHRSIKEESSGSLKEESYRSYDSYMSKRVIVSSVLILETEEVEAASPESLENLTSGGNIATKRKEKKLLFLLYTAVLMICMDRSFFSYVSYNLSMDYQWKDNSRFLMQCSFLTGYCLNQIYGGILADKTHFYKKILIFSSLLTLALSYLFLSLYLPFIPVVSKSASRAGFLKKQDKMEILIIIIRGLIGVSQGFFFPAIQSIITSFVSKDHFARAGIAIMTCVYVGTSLGFVFGPSLLSFFPVAWVSLVFGLFFLLGTFYWMIAFPSPQDHADALPEKIVEHQRQLSAKEGFSSDKPETREKESRRKHRRRESRGEGRRGDRRRGEGRRGEERREEKKGEKKDSLRRVIGMEEGEIERIDEEGEGEGEKENGCQIKICSPDSEKRRRSARSFQFRVLHSPRKGELIPEDHSVLTLRSNQPVIEVEYHHHVHHPFPPLTRAGEEGGEREEREEREKRDWGDEDITERDLELSLQAKQHEHERRRKKRNPRHEDGHTPQEGSLHETHEGEEREKREEKRGEERREREKEREKEKKESKNQKKGDHTGEKGDLIQWMISSQQSDKFSLMDSHKRKLFSPTVISESPERHFRSRRSFLSPPIVVPDHPSPLLPCLVDISLPPSPQVRTHQRLLSHCRKIPSHPSPLSPLSSPPLSPSPSLAMSPTPHTEQDLKTLSTWTILRHLLQIKSIWGIIFCHFFLGFTLNIMMIILPEILSQVYQISLSHQLFISPLPYLLQFFLCLHFSSILNIFLRRVSCRVLIARRFFYVAGLLVSNFLMLLIIFLFNQMHQILAILCLVLSIAANSITMVNININILEVIPYWSGTVYGIANTINTLGNVMSLLLFSLLKTLLLPSVDMSVCSTSCSFTALTPSYSIDVIRIWRWIFSILVLINTFSIVNAFTCLSCRIIPIHRFFQK